MAVVQGGSGAVLTTSDGRQIACESASLEMIRYREYSSDLSPCVLPSQAELTAQVTYHTTELPPDLFQGECGLQFSGYHELRLQHDVCLRGYTAEQRGDGLWEVSCNFYIRQKRQTVSEHMRGIIQSRHAPAFIGRNRCLGLPADVREARARETLRRVIGTEAYRRFVAKGFVSATGKSGKVYQIFPGSGMTNVFDGGQYIEKLCVVLNGNFVPTDSVIMRYLLITNDEQLFRRKAILHAVYQREPQKRSELSPRSLADIHREIKTHAV